MGRNRQEKSSFWPAEVFGMHDIRASYFCSHKCDCMQICEDLPQVASAQISLVGLHELQMHLLQLSCSSFSHSVCVPLMSPP